jgi:hypothetical protein
LKGGITQLIIYDENTDEPTDGFINPVEFAERTVFYIKQSGSIPFYFWVLDEIQKDETEPAEYDWHLITRIDNDIDATSNPVKIYQPGNNDTLDIFTVKPAQGSYSFNFSTIPSATSPYSNGKKISLIHNAVKGQFNVLLVPTTAGLPDKTYSNYPMISGDGVKVDWSNGYDDYLFYSEENCIEYASSHSDANQVFLRENNSTNKYSQFFMRNGSELNFEGIQIVELYGSMATVVCDSDIVHIKGDNITKAKIYAPYA